MNRTAASLLREALEGELADGLGFLRLGQVVHLFRETDGILVHVVLDPAQQEQPAGNEGQKAHLVVWLGHAGDPWDAPVLTAVVWSSISTAVCLVRSVSAPSIVLISATRSSPSIGRMRVEVRSPTTRLLTL